jgi:outer membrane protein assembly factor BamB
MERRETGLAKVYGKILTGLIIGLLIWINISFTGLNAAALPPETQEVTVTGNAMIGEDPDRMYKAAMEDAFQQAYSKIRPQDYSEISRLNNSPKDPLSIQREMGIVQYQILRYWQENNRFMIELKVVFGNTPSEKPRMNGLGRMAKLSWTYQSMDQIRSMGKTKNALAVNTTQTIEVVDTDTGQRLEQFKMGLNPHEFYGDQYITQEGEYIKVARLTKYNLFKLVYSWRQKIPDFSKAFLSRDNLFILDKTGLIKALKWDDGSVKWQLPASSQAELDEIVYNRFLITFPVPDVWMVNAYGEKLWAIKFETSLLAKPVSSGNEVFCLLKNGQLQIVDRETGRIISTWTVNNQASNKNVQLQLSEKELFIMYNEANRGHLQAYHRLTGKLLWEIGWDQAVAGSLLNVADVLVVGVGNSFEARDPLFGIKLWEEPTYGRVTKMYSITDKIFVVAGNRVYGYDLK